MHESFFEMFFGTSNLKKSDTELTLVGYKGRFWLTIGIIVFLVLGLIGQAIIEYNEDARFNNDIEAVDYKAVSQASSELTEVFEVPGMIISSYKEVLGEYYWILQLIFLIIVLGLGSALIRRFVEVTGLQVKGDHIRIKKGFGSFQNAYLDEHMSQIEDVSMQFKGKNVRTRLLISLKLRSGQEQRFKLPARVFGQQSLKDTAEWMMARDR